MSDLIGSATSYAISGLNAAQNQVAVDAQNIATDGPSVVGSPFGSSGPSSPGLTGTQPTNVAGQVQQAIGTTQKPDLTTSLVDLITARNLFAANIDTLNVATQTQKQAINIIT